MQALAVQQCDLYLLRKANSSTIGHGCFVYMLKVLSLARQEVIRCHYILLVFCRKDLCDARVKLDSYPLG